MKDFNGTNDGLSSEIERRQRKLIPLNIVVAILALVSALSIMFAPLITIDISKSGDVLSEILQEETGGEETDEDIDVDEIVNILTEADDLKISLTTYSMIKFAFTADPVDFIATEAAEILNEITDNLIIDVMIPAVTESLSNEGLDIPEITSAQAILDKFKALETASSSEVDEAIQALAEELQNQLGKDFISDESLPDFCDTIREIYDETVSYTGGTFSIEACLCVIVSEAMNGEDSGEVYTSYKEFIYSIIDSSDLDDAMDTAVLGIKIAALAISFIALLWGILFLFAFIRIFTKNKRFTMWYVKLFGLWPCLLFGVLPLAAPSIIAAIAGESVAFMNAIFGMISSLTWISGACYIALWIVSIFWAFPIKRKIRAYKRELKAAQY